MSPIYRPALLGSLLVAAVAAQAQTSGSVGIGTSTPDAKAALDISSTDKGLLIPRLTESQRTVMTGVPTGLMVFQTNGTQPGFWYYFGGQWNRIPAGDQADNLGNHTANQNLGLNGNWLSNATGNNNGLRIANNGNVGVGTAAPGYPLDVNGDFNSSGVLRQGGNASLYWRGTNAFIGTNSFATTAPTGTNNVLVGTDSGANLTTGNDNATLGRRAGAALTSGSSNVLLGNLAGAALTNVSNNVFIGNSAGGSASANNSVGIGNSALAFAQGQDNVGVGQSAGSNVTTGVRNVFLGHSAALSSLTRQRDRATAIGYRATVDQDDAVVLGDPSNADVRVGIGTSTPAQKLDVNGQVYSRSGGFRFPDNTVQTTAVTTQTLSLNGLTLGISNGNTVTLPAGADNLGNHTATEPLKYSADDADKILFLNATGANGPKLSHGSGWTLDYYAGPNSGNNGVHRFLTGTATGWQERVRIANDGEVGIGTADPQATLDVNGSVRMGARGTTFRNLRTGSFTNSGCGTAQCNWTINFGQPFTSTPFIVATAVNQPGTNYSDVFAVTVRSISSTQVVFNIRRVDDDAPWAQTLRINYMIWEQ